jgi:hypothetical protein
MSITYPEVQTSSPRAAVSAVSPNVMNSGSALFPIGSAKVYERAVRARASRSLPLAWIAAPAAVVLIGGAVYLSTAQHPMAARSVAPVPSAQTVSGTTTTRTTAPGALSPAPAAPAAPVETTRHVATRSRVTQSPAAPPASHVARTITRTQAVSAAQPAPAPVMATPVQGATPAATPGTFAFTPPPASAASDPAQPMSQSAAPGTTDTGLAPAAPSAAAPSGGDASPQ